MKLLFAGDLAWPTDAVLAYEELAALCDGARMVVNLEGGVVAGGAEQCAVNNAYKFNLYSHPSVAATLTRLNVIACSLANNHISDYVGGLAASKALLAEHGIGVCGTRAQPYCHFTVGQQAYLVFGACSPLPEPRAEPREDQAMRFEPAAALAQLADLRRQFPQATLVAFLHWGVELASFPQPADREWARQAIEAGVDLVIGHHPHVVQGVEQHRHGVIAYSLGNLLLPQVDYRGRTLHYRSEDVCEQLVLALEDGDLKAHWLRYEPGQRRLRYLGGGPAADDPKLRARTPYAGLDDAAYRRWFARHGRAGAAKGGAVVLWSYRGWRRVDTAVKLALLAAKAVLRKLAIRSGLHRPYNW